MSKRALAAAGIVAALLAATLLPRLNVHTRPAMAQTSPPDIPVTATTVTTRDVPEFLHGIGTVQAFNMVTVKTRVDGPIVKVAFTEGQEVKQGDLLFQIDPRPYQAALEQAQAAKERDQAQLVTAQMDLDRYAHLVGSGFQTRQSYDEQKGLVAQYGAAIKGDEAQIDTARLNLSFTAITSPIDGRLGARLVDIGNLIHASDNTALVTITQLRPIFASFTLPQDTLDQIRQYQHEAPLSVIAVSGDNKTELAQGALTLIDNAIDQTTGTIHLKATFANQDERLWPGEFVNVRVVLRMRHDVATVPSQSVEEGPDGDFVYVIGANDTVERRAIEVAAKQDGIAVIHKGLKPGEHVVVEGQYRLTDGAHVRATQAAPG